MAEIRVTSCKFIHNYRDVEIQTNSESDMCEIVPYVYECENMDKESSETGIMCNFTMRFHAIYARMQRAANH